MEMPRYRVLAAGRRRSFCLTFGLKEGYGPTGKLHPIDMLRAALLRWMEKRAAAGRPFLSGTLRPCEVLYAWPSGPGQAGSRSEPGAEFRGETSPTHHADLSDADVVDALCDLGAFAGGVVGQERVYASFLDQAWILERVISAAPVPRAPSSAAGPSVPRRTFPTG